LRSLAQSFSAAAHDQRSRFESILQISQPPAAGPIPAAGGFIVVVDPGITANSPQRQQLASRFNLWLCLLAKDGRHAGVTMWGPKEFAVADEQGARLQPCVALFNS
jgi:hypothetical protein